MADLTDEELEQIMGHRGWEEYGRAPDWAKPKIRIWAATLADMSDEYFVSHCAGRILDSAQVISFRGNWEGDHAKASACWAEAKRRYEAAGHVDCEGDNLYVAAYNRAFRSQGYTPRPWNDCTCGVGNEAVRQA
jgi:hypothetical protein